jgi:hypothetical protein
VAYPASERVPRYREPRRDSVTMIALVAIFLGVAVAVLFFVALWMGVSAQNARDDARAAAAKAGTAPAATTAHDHSAHAAAATQSFAGAAPANADQLASSPALALRRLRRIPLSGQTPLADSLRRARTLLRQELFKHPNSVPLLVVVTDGRPAVPLRVGADPTADVLAEGRALRRVQVPCIVADTSTGDGCAGELARAAGGLRLPVAAIAPSVLLDTLGKMT